MDGIYVYHYHNVSINKVFRILSTDKNPPYIFFSVYKKSFPVVRCLSQIKKKKTYLHDISDIVK